MKKSNAMAEDVEAIKQKLDRLDNFHVSQFCNIAFSL